jgi:protein phosphatase
MAVPRLIIAHSTDRGRVRGQNEDFYGLPPVDLDPQLAERKGLLYVVADGMGGEAGGQRASLAAVQALIRGYYLDPDVDLPRSLQSAIQSANRAVYREARANPEISRMGTTLTAVVIRSTEVLVGHVGDTRAYLLRNGQMRQLTHDHTWVAEALRKGTLTPRQAQTHPNRNVLTRALGSDPSVEAFIGRETLQPGDRLFLCSDGLYNLVTDADIQTTLQQSRDAQAAIDELVAMANGRGGYDNITAMVVGMPAVTPERKPRPVTPPSPNGKTGVTIPLPVVGGAASLLVIVMLGLGINRFITQPERRVKATAEASAAGRAFAKATAAQSQAMATAGAAVQANGLAPEAVEATQTAVFATAKAEVAAANTAATETVEAAIAAFHQTEEANQPTVKPTAMSSTVKPTPGRPPPSTPTPAGTVNSIQINTPLDGSRVDDDSVSFTWSYSGRLGDGEVFDVRVCRGDGCVPESGIANETESSINQCLDPGPYWWLRQNGESIYRWQVVVIEKDGEHIREQGTESPIRSFEWSGGCGSEKASTCTKVDNNNNPVPCH